MGGGRGEGGGGGRGGGRCCDGEYDEGQRERYGEGGEG